MQIITTRGIRTIVLYKLHKFLKAKRAEDMELYRVTQKKRELLKPPTKIEEIQKKKLTEIEPLQLVF